MDKPNARKVHTRIMPRMGGLAIYLSFFAVLFLSHGFSKQLLGIFLGGTILVLVGIIDDMKDIPAKVKLLGQIVAACVVVAFGVRVDFMTNIFQGDTFFLSFFSIPVTIIWIVAIINAVNLIDGLDGLAAGISTIAAITMAIAGYASGQTEMASMAMILIGSTLGFLRYNFHPAKISWVIPDYVSRIYLGSFCCFGCSKKFYHVVFGYSNFSFGNSYFGYAVCDYSP